MPDIESPVGDEQVHEAPFGICAYCGQPLDPLGEYALK